MNSQDIDEDIYSYRSLSDLQKKVLAILPIPSAILSILGSSIIIYMAMRSRKSKPWTPYNRLLVAMSIYDVITSITLAIADFLYPKETSNKAWAFGNDATCSMIGFLNQLAYSGTFYNALLSYYFLLTARFAVKNEQIARRIEPAMHIMAVGFPAACGFVGLILDVYAEPEVNIGCWVNRYPKRCGYGPDGTGEPCKSSMLAWVFGGWIAFFALISLVANNLVIWIFVRKQVKMQRRRMQRRSLGTKNAEMNESYQSDDDDDDDSKKQFDDASSSMASSFRTLQVKSQRHSQEITEIVGQKRRLVLVSSQAFLFVASYAVCSFSTYILRLFESQATTYVGEMELPYNNYILLVLQALFFPLQGLFNMFVYVRPKYLRFRAGYRRETRLWAFRRAILGSSVEPLHSMNGGMQTGKNQSKNQVRPATEAKDGVSSLINGSGNMEEEADRNRNLGGANGASHMFSSSLGVISESSGEILVPSQIKAAPKPDSVLEEDDEEHEPTVSDPQPDVSATAMQDSTSHAPEVNAGLSFDSVPIEEKATRSNIEQTMSANVSMSLLNDTSAPPAGFPHLTNTGWSRTLDTIPIDDQDIGTETSSNLDETPTPPAGFPNLTKTGWSMSLDTIPIDTAANDKLVEGTTEDSFDSIPLGHQDYRSKMILMDGSIQDIPKHY
jgi:hypothetical protein